MKVFIKFIWKMKLIKVLYIVKYCIMLICWFYFYLVVYDYVFKSNLVFGINESIKCFIMIYF